MIIKEINPDIVLTKDVVVDGVLERVEVTIDELKEIGDFVYVGNTKNKIKKISDNEYMFIRFEPVDTHIEKFIFNRYSISDFKKEIIDKLDYTLKYADDRKKLVDELLKKNAWVYNLVSSINIINRVHKKKTSFLAENQTLDSLMNYLSTYINHARFKNKNEEDEYSELIKKKKEIESNKVIRDLSELDKLISKIQSFHHRVMKNRNNQLYKERKKVNNSKYSMKEDRKIELVGNMDKREGYGDFTNSDELEYRRKQIKILPRDKEIPSWYWDKMYKNKDVAQFRKDTLENIKKDFLKLHAYLGYDIKDMEDRKKHIENLIKELDKVSKEKSNKEPFKSMGLKFPSGQRQYQIIRGMYNNLKNTYEFSKSILTDEIKITRKVHDTTYYNINSDTWYEDENNEIVELSKNMLLLSDINVYKGLILNYSTLKDKYRDKFDTDIWALLFTFEELVKNTEFTNDEKFVLECLFENMNQTQIREKYASLNVEQMTSRRVSNLINNIIPNKILNTYLNSVEDWLYTFKLKGKYKTCAKCGEVKLIINDRHFSRDSTRNDGFYPYCRECRKE